MNRKLHKVKYFLYKLILNKFDFSQDGFYDNYYYKDDYYKNYYYQRILNQYDNTNSYLSLYKNQSNNVFLKTDTDICFSKTIKFNSSINEVKKELNKPNYHITSNKFNNVEILFYRILIGNHKVKCQMHFFAGKLFLYNYIFSYLQKNESNEIINIIQEKYIPHVNDYSNQIIIDSNNNCLQINNDVELTVNYFSLNSNFVENIVLISQYEKEQQKKKDRVQKRRIYNKL